MSIFGNSESDSRYGIVIDIGSGSVLAAIVHSNIKQKHPKIVWSHREHAPLRNIESIEQSAKSVMTALVNVSMLLDSEGRKALYEYDNKSKIKEFQCSIAAPWSYTVTKTINYNQEKPFTITDELINELIDTIQEKVKNELKENEVLHDLGLQIIARSDVNILSNGYRVKYPKNEKALNISVSHTNAIAQTYLINAIDEIRDRLFAETKPHKISFIIMLFTISRYLLPETYDICLVDITYEATEIGIVRDGSLKYCTHTPFGSFSLTREISAITGVPLYEAFGYLHTDKPYSFIDSLSKSKAEDVNAMFEAYIEKVSALFHETGDSLSIPKNIAIHSDLKSETLFLDLIEKAAKRSIKTNVNIKTITNEIIKQTYEQSTKGAKLLIPEDTALLLSAQFFHTQPKHLSFKYY
jgi:hypothetical protein